MSGQPVFPAVGQRWTCSTEDGTRTVTVTSVWDDRFDRTAVAFEWRDDKPGQCGSALPLAVFLGTYKPEQPEPDAADPWAVVARLTAWLDNHNGSSTPETALRILKVPEEAGEVAAAWIGVMGQNPRKGRSHTVDDVADELCDVIVAAMVALATLKADPGAHFARKLAQVAALRLDTADGGA